MINCTEDGQQEEILPDNFVTTVQHQGLRPEDTHEMAAHEVVGFYFNITHIHFLFLLKRKKYVMRC